VSCVLDVLTLGLDSDPLDYHTGWALQRAVHADVVAGTRPDTLILCEHAPVYTAGKRSEPHERPRDGTPVVDVDRGGKITWHGPGQLVGYPIVRLPQPVDVVAFVRRLEQVMIDALAEFGVPGERVEGRSGVWHRTEGGTDKLGAVGLRVKEDVTMHGFALNCDNDLAPYQAIVPCGISDAGVTTASAIAGRAVTTRDAAEAVLRSFRAAVPA
jgi:lipoyl(octanoyl) transferase